MQQICLDEPFITIMLEKSSEFIKLGILPELVGKWYSKLLVMLSAGDAPTCNTCISIAANVPTCKNDNTSASTIQVRFGAIVEYLDDELIGWECTIQWYHVSCL